MSQSVVHSDETIDPRARALEYVRDSGPVFFSRPTSADFQGSTLSNAGGHVYNLSHSISTTSNQINLGTRNTLNITSNPSTSSVAARSDSEVYIENLLPKKRGFPLWLPQPSGNLPMEYRRDGVNIGDVGVITSQGFFDFLFNICRPSDDPINGNGVPDNFSPLGRPKPSETFTAGLSCTHFASRRIVELSSASRDLLQAYPRDRFSFECLRPEGAILILPDEAVTVDFQGVASFRDYAIRNGESWYRYANGPRRREAENGALYLVTGFDKTRYWGVASFSDAPSAFQVTFSTRTGTMDREGACDTYYWEDTGYAGTMSGPNPIEYFDGAQEPPLNQCAFIRGFKISLSHWLWASLVGQTTDATTIVGMKSSDALLKSNFVPFSGRRSSFGGFLSSLIHRSAGHEQANSASEGPELETTSAVTPSDDSNDVIVGSDFQPASYQYHPSNMINEYLLQQIPDARIAITHDNDWCAVITKNDDRIPDTLLTRINTTFDVKHDPVNGAVYLVSSDRQTPRGMPDLPDLSDVGTMADYSSLHFSQSLPTSLIAAGLRSRRTFSAASISSIFSRSHWQQEQSTGIIKSTSGGVQTWPELAENWAMNRIRIPVAQDDIFICSGGVDVAKLLRISRATVCMKARAAVGIYLERNESVVLVDEQWHCEIVASKYGNDLAYKAQIRYSGLATVSEYADSGRPVALNQVKGVLGLMTILDRK